MRYPLDELIDKRSIVQLKIERIKDYADRERLKKEYQDYTAAINEYIQEGVCGIEDVKNWHSKLYEANGNTWDLEAIIRQGRDGEISLEEVGRRSIEIRKSNAIRIGIKSSIVEKIGMGYKDIKINHGSA